MAIDLNFTSKGINDLEKRHNQPVANLIGREVISILVQFIRAGKPGISEDDAFAIIDEYRKADGSTTKLQIDIIKSLEDQGFLEKGLGLSQKIENQIQRVSSMDSLEDIGAASNRPQ